MIVYAAHTQTHTNKSTTQLLHHTHVYYHVILLIQIQSRTAYQSADQLTWNTSSVYRNIMHIRICTVSYCFRLLLLAHLYCMCACGSILYSGVWK